MSNKIHPTSRRQTKQKEDILTAIRELPFELQDLIKEKLTTIQESPQLTPENRGKLATIISQISSVFKKPTRTVRLSEVNKKLHENYGYTARLKKLDSTYQNTSINQVANNLDEIIGNIPMSILKKKNNTNTQFATALKSINNKLRTDTDNLFDNSDLNLQRFNTLAEAKKDYIKRNPDKNFDEESKKWSTLFNTNYKTYKNYALIKSAIQKYKQIMLDYDKPNQETNRQILESFLKLDENKITYRKASNSIKSLPLSAKAIIKRLYQ